MKRFLTCFIATFALLLLAVEGSFAQTVPSVQARYVAFSNITTSQANASWINGNGAGRIVVIRTDNTWDATNTALASITSAFYDVNGNRTDANIQEIGTTGSYVIDVVTGATRVSNFTNLTPGTTYYVKVYEFNASGALRAYKTNDGTNNPRSFATTGTLVAPTWTTSPITVDDNNNTVMINWNNVTGANGYYLYISTGTGVNFLTNVLSEYNGVDVGSLTTWEAYLPVAGTYYIALRSYAGAITSALSSEQTASISSSMPPKFLAGDAPSLQTLTGTNSGNFELTVTFDQDVYNSNAGSGDLTNSSFAAYAPNTGSGLTDASSKVVITGVTKISQSVWKLNIRFNARVASTEGFRIGPASATSIYSGIIAPATTGIPMEVTLHATKGGQYSADITCPNASVLNITDNIAFTTIQGAIDAGTTAAGETIQLKESTTYSENVTVNKAVTITDQNANDAIVTGTWTLGGASTVDIGTGNINISNLTFAPAGSSSIIVGDIISTSGSINIDDNTFNLGSANKTGVTVHARRDEAYSNNLFSLDINSNIFTGTNGNAINFIEGNQNANGGITAPQIYANTFPTSGVMAINFPAGDISTYVNVISLGLGNANSDGMLIPQKYVYSHATLDTSDYLYCGIAVLGTTAPINTLEDGTATAYGDVNLAIDDSGNDGTQTVFLGQGTYTEAIALDSAVSLVGKGANATTGTVLTNTLTASATAAAYSINNLYFDCPATHGLVVSAVPTGGLIIDNNNFQIGANEYGINVTAATIGGSLQITSDTFALNDATAIGINLPNNQITAGSVFSSNTFSGTAAGKGLYISTTNSTGASNGTISITDNTFSNTVGDAIVFEDAVDITSNPTYHLGTSTINIYENNFSQSGYGIEIDESSNYNGFVGATLPNSIDLYIANSNTNFTAADIYGAAWYDLTGTSALLYPSIQNAETANAAATLYIGAGTYAEDVTIDGTNITTITGNGSTCELASGKFLQLDKNLTAITGFSANEVRLGNNNAEMTDALAAVKANGTIKINSGVTTSDNATVNKSVTITETAASGTYSGQLTIATGGVTVSDLDLTGNPAITVAPTTGITNPIAITGNTFTLVNGGNGLVVETGNATAAGTAALNVTGNSFTDGDATSAAIRFRNQTTGFANFTGVNVYDGNTFNIPGYDFYRVNENNLCTYLPSIDVKNTIDNNYTTPTTFGFYYNPAAATLSTSTENLVTDCTPPAAFTTGAVTPVGNNVVAGFFNSTNTHINVVVPIANDPSLEYGTIQIQIDNDGDNSWVNVTNSGLVTITAADITNGTKTVQLAKADLVASGDFDQGTSISFRAVITDFAGQSTNGTPSGNTIYRDETAPVATLNSATADNIINIAEKTAGFNVNAQANENNVTLYVVNVTDNTPDYTNIGTVGFASASAPTAGNAVNIAVSANNANIVEGKTYRVFAMDQAGNLSAQSGTSFTADLTAPAAPTNVVINGGNPINNANKTTTTLSFQYTEAAKYSYTYTTSGGTGTVSATDVNATGSPVTINNIDLSSLEDGTITVSVTVKDAAGNESTATTDTEMKDVVAPTAPTVVINGGNPINASNYTAVSLQISGEIGTTYAYAFTPDNGTPVTGNGTLDVSPKTLTNIDLTNILDGTVTATVTLTDAAGNVSTAGTDTELKDVVAPSAFTTGAVVSTGGNVVAAYWNATNTGLDVTVPVANDATLTGGTIQVQASKDGNTWLNLGSAHTITTINTNTTLSFTDTQFEGLAGFAEGDVWSFRAVLTDVAGNSTNGTASANTKTVDQVAPTATLVSATADNVINIAEKSAGFNVVAQSNEATQTLYVVDVTTNPTVTYSNIGTVGFATAAVAGANTNTNIPVSANNTNIITGSTYKVYTIDAAGNLSAASTGSFTTDLVAPTITSITSTTADGLYGIGAQINFTLTTDEAAIFTANGGQAALDMALTTGTTDAIRTTDKASSTTLELTYTVANGDSKTDLTYTDGAVVLSGGATWTDAAGNPVVLTTPTGGAAAFAAAKAIDVDGVPPTFTVDYYLNSVTGIPLGTNPTIGIGNNYYIKITSSEELQAAPTISIAGLDNVTNPNNIVSNANTFVHLANTIFSYNRIVVETQDNGTDELITITGTDLAGNTASNAVPTNAFPTATPANTGKQAKVDGKRPQPVITLAAPVDYNDGTNDWTNNNPIAVNINYGETVQNVTNSVISVTNGTKSNFVNTSNTVFTVDVTPNPTAQGTTVTVSVPEGNAGNQIKDAGGNFAYGATKSIKYDGTAPTTTDNVPAAWQNSDITITFSPNDGAGSGVAKVYYTTDGSNPTTASNFVTSAQNYQITISTDGQYTIKYRAEDNVGNLENVVTAANQAKLDKTAPAIVAGTITAPTNTTKWNGGNHDITWTNANITDATSGLTATPISLYYTTNASDPSPTWTLIASGLANDGTETWNVPNTINSTDVKVRIDAVDNAGNIASQVSQTFTIDNLPPTATITITPNNSPLPNGYSINNATTSVTIDADFNENMDQTLAPTLTLNTELDNILNDEAPTTAAWQSATKYRWVLAVNGNGLSKLDNTIDVTNAKDLAQNTMTPAQLANVKVDQVLPTLPTVTIASNNAVTPGTGSNAGFAKVGDDVTVAFNASEVLQTPTATIYGNAANVSGSGTSWTAVRSMTSGDVDGAVTFQINFSDLAGNAGTPVTAVTNASSITFDKTAPVVAITAPANNAYVNGTQALTFTVTETNTHQSEAKFGSGTYTSVTSGDLINTLNGWTAAAEVVNSIDVRHIDKAGNVGTATINVTKDVTAPSIVSITRGNVTNGDNTNKITNDDVVTFTVTFSETVQNFDAADISLNKTGTINTPDITVSGSGATYTVTVGQNTNIAGDGTLGITVNVSNITDLAANALASSSTSANFTIDNTPPTVANVVNNCNNSPVSGYLYNQAAQITFSEGVYTNSNASGALVNADLNITSSGGNATLQSWNVISGSHTAGGTTLNITTNWNGTILGSEQLRADAATAASIYDQAGNAMAVAGANQGGPNPPKNWDYTKAQIVILTQPVDATTCETGSAQFTTSAQGGLSVAYQWQYHNGTNWVDLTNTTIDGATFSGATTSQLTITNPPYSNWNGKQFRCNVTNDCGNQPTNVVTLTVNPNVAIQTQPSNQQACYGSVDATFSVVATGTGPYTYTWEYYNGSTWVTVSNGTPANATYTGATTANLNVTGNIAVGAYQYRVVVGGGCGAPVTSNTATLTVNSVPNAGLTVQAQNTTVCTGSGTNIQVVNSENGVSYQLHIGIIPVGSPVNGNGGTINLPTGNLITTTTFNVVATNANCPVQLTQTATVTVEATPVNPTLATATPTSGSTVCQGSTVSATFNAGSGGSADEFRYSLDNGSNWTAYTPGNNLTVGTQTVLIQGRRNAVACTPGAWTTLATWNVELTPVASTLYKSPNTAAVCAGTNVSATLNTAGAGGNGTDTYEYRTKVSGNWGSWQAYTLGNNIGTTGVEEVEIRATRNANVCTPASNTYSWTVNPLPTATISGTTPACQNTLLTATTNASSPSYQWKLNTNNIIGATSSTYTATASGNYTVVVTDGVTGCSYESAPYAVQIDALPNVYTVSGGPFCAGSNIAINLSGSQVGYTYNVKLGTNTVTSATGTGSSMSIPVTSAAAGTYTVEAVNGTCTQAMTGNVLVNPAPTANAGAPTSTCGTTPVNVNDATATNYTGLLWTHNGAGSLTNATTLTPTYTPAAGDYGNVVTLTLTVNGLTGCSNAQSTKLITVYPPTPSVPNVTSTNGSSFCDVANTVLTATSAGATGFTWYSDAGLTNQIGTGATYTITNLNATTTYYVTATNSCGTSAAGSFTVTVNTSPAAPTITGNTSVCAGATGVTYSVGTYSSYNWTVTNGTITAGQGTNTITVTWSNTPGTGNVAVAITDANGCSANNSINVTINALPTPAISGANSVNVNTNLSLTSTNTYNAYQWSATGSPTITDGTSQTATFNWSSAGSYVVTLTVTDANGCQNSTTHNVTVNATQAPVITGNPNNATSCDPGTAQFSVTSVSGLPAPTLEWQVSTDNGNNWSAVSGPDYSGANTTTLTVNNVTGKHGYQYRLYAYNGILPDAYSNAATLTITTPVTPSVTIASSDVDNEFCAGTNVTFTATVNNTGGGTVAYQWKLNGNNVGANQNTYTTNTLANNDQVWVVITITGGCVTTNTATSNTITNTVLSVPAQPSVISGNTTVCQTETGVAYSVTPVSGVTYTWSYSGTGATIYNNGNASITIDFAANATSGTLSVIPSNSCGNGTAQTLAITVNTLPTITAHPQNTSVAEGGNATFNVTATGGTLSYQWQQNDGNGWNDIAGATTSTLTLNSVTASMDGYQYRAVVTNNCGSQNSNAATLTILAALPTQQPSFTLSASKTSISVASITPPTTPTATGMFRLFLAIQGGASPTQNPVDGNSYGANSDWTFAPLLGNGRVVNDGNITSFSIINVPNNTLFRIIAYGYNQIGSNVTTRVYNTTLGADNNKTVKTKLKEAFEDEVISGTTFDVSRVAPNPVSNEMYLDVIGGNATAYTFELYNSVGERVFTRVMELPAGRNEVVLSVQNAAGVLPAGVYNLRVHNGSEYIDQRIVIMP
ncbi:MAG: FN3 associated domain-containing protein [Bacteroidota bacterium]